MGSTGLSLDSSSTEPTSAESQSLCRNKRNFWIDGLEDIHSGDLSHGRLKSTRSNSLVMSLVRWARSIIDQSPRPFKHASGPE